MKNGENGVEAGGGPLSGVALSVGRPPAARCAGAKMSKNFNIF